jgi:Cu/Ag efflux protein CusF
MKNPSSVRRARLAPALLLLALAFALACGAETGQGRGTIQSVDMEAHTITIDHGNIPGLMDAMVMPFDVDDPQLLETAEVGSEVEFEVAYDGRRYVITALRPLP